MDKDTAEAIKAELAYIEANTIATSDPRTTRMVDPDKVQYYLDKTLEKLQIHEKVRIKAKFVGKYLEPRATEMYEFKVWTQKQTSYHDAGIDVEQYVLMQDKEEFFYTLAVDLITSLMESGVVRKNMTKIYRKLD